MKIFLLTLIIALSSCGSKEQGKTPVCFNSIEQIEKELLFKNDSVLALYGSCYKISRLEDVADDEGYGITWRKYQCMKDKKVAFIVETSPLNISIISRISVYDSSYKAQNNKVYVGQSFKEIKHIINYGYWDESTGIFYLKQNAESRVVYELNSNKVKEFKRWEQNIKNIPDNVQISCIIISVSK